ncbi:hypothetical protein E2C01_063730 [Portunus trituberculatus]|uniref:Uncharacterized protein n=1 Tax=Portunus trituberculatus TaxID=210409 RepID=A0A5B7HLQ0_PORTR|nr:hypothetical protein [Portunus trituberculatus]
MRSWLLFFSQNLAHSLSGKTEISPRPFLFLFSSAGGEWPSRGLTLKGKRASPSAGSGHCDKQGGKSRGQRRDLASASPCPPANETRGGNEPAQMRPQYPPRPVPRGSHPGVRLHGHASSGMELHFKDQE